MDAARWEGIAQGMLDEVGVDEAVDPRALATAYGLRLEPVHSRAACWDGEVVRYPAKARPRRQAGLIAHELGHHGLSLEGEPQSEAGASYVGAGLLVPRRVLDRELKRFGWDLPALQRVFPHASAELLARRIAELRDAVVTIVDGRRIKARVGSPWRELPDRRLTGREQDALARARADGTYRSDLVSSWNLSEPNHERVIIISDQEQLSLPL